MPNLFAKGTGLSLTKLKNGFCITKPENDYSLSKDILLADLIMAPLSVYFLNTDSLVKGVNEVGALLAGFISVKDAMGKGSQHVLKRSSYLVLHAHDKSVLYTQKSLSQEHNMILKDGRITHSYDYKFPWYDSDSNPIGIFGIAFGSGATAPVSLKESLDYLTRTFLIAGSHTTKPIQLKNSNILLSNREYECAKWVARGMTAKMIGLKLNLSPRTIEHHIENIKTKFNVNSKSELIATLISEFFDKVS